MKQREVEAQLGELARAADELLARSSDLADEAAHGGRRRRLPVSVQRASANRKLAPQNQVVANNGRIRNEPSGPYVVSTYVSIAATCPDTCAFKDGGCYAEAGAAHLTLRGLDAGAQGWPSREVTLLEAREIDALWPTGVPQDGARGGRDMRLHVSGDAADQAGARALGDAAARWTARGGGRVWTYTHRWQTIARAAWGPISVLASCETVQQLENAHELGYAAALVVDCYPAGARPWSSGRFRAIPCPAEAGNGRVTCSSCRLCMDDRRLRDRASVIAFALHGADADIARKRLPVLANRAQ